VKPDKPTVEMLRANWKVLVPTFVVFLAAPFLPARVLGSPFLFPSVVFLLLVLLLVVMRKGSAPR
jgi:hypothetical protein